MTAASRTVPLFAEPDLAPQPNRNPVRLPDAPKFRPMPLVGLDRFANAPAEHLTPLLDHATTLCGQPTSGRIDDRPRGRLPQCQACRAEAARLNGFVIDGLRP